MTKFNEKLLHIFMIVVTLFKILVIISYYSVITSFNYDKNCTVIMRNMIFS